MPRRKAQSIQSAVVKCVHPSLTDFISSNDLSLSIQAKEAQRWVERVRVPHFAPKRLQLMATWTERKRETPNKSDATSQMSHINFSGSFVQATLARSDYARPQSDCQPNSVSQYLPVVIRVDGLINKGKLQERKQTSIRLHQNICAPLASGKATQVPTGLEPKITGSLPFG